MFQLEVCVDSLEGVEIAMRSGATRIELSDRLSVGGITPPKQLMIETLRISHIPIVALIRCRPGNFAYTLDEKQEMYRQCEEVMELGVHAIAVGAHTPTSTQSGRELDWEFLDSIANRFSAVELVVHRAFDQVQDPIGSASRLGELGFHRILTSGGPAHAEEGLDVIRELQSARKIEILPAGGIGSHNAAHILTTTRCTQLHGSFRKKLASTGKFSSLPDPNEIKQVLFAFQHQ
jgi:copper homeostasis protein